MSLQTGDACDEREESQKTHSLAHAKFNQAGTPGDVGRHGFMGNDQGRRRLATALIPKATPLFQMEECDDGLRIDTADPDAR